MAGYKCEYYYYIIIIMTPNSNSAEIFVRCVYSQVSSFFVYWFGSYHVDTHTNPQTHPQQTDYGENIQRSSLRYDAR